MNDSDRRLAQTVLILMFLLGVATGIVCQYIKTSGKHTCNVSQVDGQGIKHVWQTVCEVNDD